MAQTASDVLLPGSQHESGAKEHIQLLCMLTLTSGNVVDGQSPLKCFPSPWSGSAQTGQEVKNPSARVPGLRSGILTDGYIWSF